MIFMRAALFPSMGSRWGSHVGRHVAPAVMVLVLDADLDVGRQRGEPECEEEHRDGPLHDLQAMTGLLRILGCEPAPLHREAIEADGSVYLDGEQQYDVQRP